MESSISSKLATISSESIKGNQIFDLSYWFGYPGSSEVVGLVMLIVIASLLLLGAGFFLLLGFRSSLTPPKKKFVTKVGWYLLSFACVGFLLISFRYFGVVFLSVRFAWVLLFAALGFALYLLFREYSQKLPAKQVQYESYLLKKKYLPRKKRVRFR